MTKKPNVKHIIFSALLFCIGFSLRAQQLPMVSQYMFNPMMLNPSYAGSTNAITAGALHRQQWYDLGDRPTTTLVSIDAPVQILRGGVGLTFASDGIGIFKTTTFQLSYNYKMDLGPGTLAMGIDGGFSNLASSLKDLRPPDTEDDNLLTGKSDISKFLFLVGASVNYRVDDQYEIGVALGNINQPHSSDVSYTLRRALKINGSYVFNLDILPVIDWVPSALIVTDFTDFQVDLSMIGMYNKQYWGGISYRFGDAVSLMGGLFIKQVQVGLAYDISTSWMSKASKIGGGFEIFLKYRFNLSVDRLPKSYKNSRYL